MGMNPMGGPSMGGPTMNAPMDVSARTSTTRQRDPTIVPTYDWSLENIEIVKRAVMIDHVIECLNKGLRSGQVERTGKYSLRIKPMNRPQELIVRAQSGGFSIQLVLI
jgi:predicted  nucleic acid-binding Zn-ribbon protein